ncbi:monofunctional biosynthetic peptidoglycan transglycosylase [Rhodobacterales bacterium 59_46_T64]|nr:monofunctional biosynthetic peptidoglycan transglycosylase [Rhodobacterales bacterium 59_46_T64]
MAKKTKKPTPRQALTTRFHPLRFLRRWTIRMVLVLAALVSLTVFAHRVINPTFGHYMRTEDRRLGDVDHHWVPLENIATVMARSAVAAEDANFCTHWGFDLNAIRAALDEGSGRGASTISQQVVKNVYLWHGHSWLRKALEAVLTPMVEAMWSKRRIVEVYLNVAEFDEGVFGIEAASRHYFSIGPEALSAVQAARLAAVLPSPKTRSASEPSDRTRRRAAQILDGAATIRADGRAACFED